MILGIAAAIFLWSHKSPPVPQQRERVVIADSKMVHSSLLYIALDQGYFHDEGLDVELQVHAYGRLALAAALEGKADMATVAEVPFANAIIAGKQPRVLAGINSSDKDIVLVSRAESRIQRAGDLIGKTVGILPGTSSEAFLALLLAGNRINAKQVHIVPVKSDEVVELLATGKLDAFAGWLSLRLKAENALKQNARILSEPGVYTESWLFTAPAAYVSSHATTIQKLLRAMVRAEKFSRMQTAGAQAIVLRYVAIAPQALRKHWSDFSFTMDLNQTIVINLEYMARMALVDKPHTPVPNFLPTIALNDMVQVDPARVTIPR